MSTALRPIALCVHPDCTAQAVERWTLVQNPRVTGPLCAKHGDEVREQARFVPWVRDPLPPACPRCTAATAVASAIVGNRTRVSLVLRCLLFVAGAVNVAAVAPAPNCPRCSARAKNDR